MKKIIAFFIFIPLLCFGQKATDYSKFDTIRMFGFILSEKYIDSETQSYTKGQKKAQCEFKYNKEDFYFGEGNHLFSSNYAEKSENTFLSQYENNEEYGFEEWLGSPMGYYRTGSAISIIKPNYNENEITIRVKVSDDTGYETYEMIMIVDKIHFFNSITEEKVLDIVPTTSNNILFNWLKNRAELCK